MSVAGVIRESVFSGPTIISACITAFVWLGLLLWASLRTIRNDQQRLVNVIAEKDTYIQQLGEIMTKRAEEHARIENANFGTIYTLREEIRGVKQQLAITKEQLEASEKKLAEERDRADQPDVTLVLDWTEDQKQTHSLMGRTEKNIFVHNRSAQFVYNVQIEPIKLSQEMTFDLINEIPSADKHLVLARWNGKSSLTTEYVYFFWQSTQCREGIREQLDV
jgi:hypothetical protein